MKVCVKYLIFTDLYKLRLCRMRRLLLFKTSILQHSDRHYLVVPVEHIPTVKDLQRRTEDHSLVSHMLNVGQNLLHRDAPQSKHRFGFHQPPLNSVNHLHLHCFALPYTPRWKHIKYMSLGCLGGFIEAEKLLERIKPFSSIPSKV
ncbi:bifunctional adenosine 5'-phosphosulfate phosphorylase/adenylylsulfatase HINT4-like isoform X2 [Camellia sinensis]|uniref:bifunctional adenosine 5'-phosphosulfate phosphorylase/adenylylsulfatase HINT4-like isoform X2 n=1 Tax=Camellia sinensis TaxID=4442 RepID=UPI001036C2E9|nr:bifunctional adenosine 5'-phosphosulfate phosphorylase/adenylylsulfatase HINT4-like isoform X2 [Camellia sinensis]